MTSKDSPLRVLIVDDDPSAVKLLEGCLRSSGYDVLTATNGVEAMTILLSEGPQMIITDWSMPEMDGLELCRRIRAHEGISIAYVITVTAHTEQDRIVEALDAGADDYLSKPFHSKELLARVRAGSRIVQLQIDLDRRNREVHRYNAEMALAHTKLGEANDKLSHMATTDELTGLCNRRAAMERLQECWSSADRHDDSVACVMLDMDHFKSINDTYGHAVGDLVLKDTAAVLRNTVRADEQVCRIGGEEFLLICPRTSETAAAVAAERLRVAVQANMVSTDGQNLGVTISLGVAERMPDMLSPDDLLAAADRALYAAKHGGRNRVCLSGDCIEEVGSEEAPAAEGSRANSSYASERGMLDQSAKVSAVADDVRVLESCGELPGPEGSAISEGVDQCAAIGRVELAYTEEVIETRGEYSRAMNLLLDFSRDLVSTESLDGVLELTIDAAAALAGSRRISIMVPDAKREYLSIAKAIGFDERIAAKIEIPVGLGIAGRVFQTGRSVVGNAEADIDVCDQRYDSECFVSTPLISRALAGSECIVGVLNITERVGNRPFEPFELAFVDLLGNIAAAGIHERLTRASRDAARDSIVVALATLAEYRDADTGRHVDRVARFCRLVGQELRSVEPYGDTITEQFLNDLERAAPLHDIGKVAVPDSILRKPGQLTEEEITVMRTHAEIGAATIRSVNERAPGAGFLITAEEIAHAHHEWYDGSGYPRGLRGEDIPLSARIAAIADVYDALSTKRPYKDAMSHERAADIIFSSTGLQFDPDVVEAFGRCEGEFKRLASELSDDSTVTSAAERSPDVPPVEAMAGASPT